MRREKEEEEEIFLLLIKQDFIIKHVQRVLCWYQIFLLTSTQKEMIR